MFRRYSDKALYRDLENWCLAFAGEGSANAFVVTISAVGNSNVEYSQQCGVTPNELDSFVDVFAGGSVEGTVCFVVPSADVGSEVIFAGALLEEPVFFATQ